MMPPSLPPVLCCCRLVVEEDGEALYKGMAETSFNSDLQSELTMLSRVSDPSSRFHHYHQAEAHVGRRRFDAFPLLASSPLLSISVSSGMGR